ncbi:MAG: hypothetical protein B7Z14_16110 [Bosea sp. 32-68-6]|nr:MAG: hypothetical protein B7Z14_16110 [Bosea sp. 32-68-6]
MSTVENPKAAAGRAKVNMGAIPPISLIYLAGAHDYGACKYSVRNWVEKPIRARDYVAPMMRHLTQWASGEDIDDGPGGSGLPHLAMLMATASVVLDAWLFGFLPETEDCAGWDLGQMQVLMEKIEAEWDRNSGDGTPPASRILPRASRAASRRLATSGSVSTTGSGGT